MKPLRWGILGTGAIARRYAKAVRGSRSGVLAAVGSRDLATAEAFAAEFGPMNASGDYASVLSDPGVEAVYIALPHPMHAEWSIRAARAGRHILCEKPAAMNRAEAEAVIDAVKENGVFFMEAFMYRCHPQTALLVEKIRSGVIGKVRLVECSFGFEAPFSAGSRLFNNKLGGGGILDVGCYCVSMARLIAGVASGWHHPAEPLVVKGVGRIDPGEGTDLMASGLLKFPGDIVAEIATGTGQGRENTVVVHGALGTLTVTQPWFAGSKGAELRIHLRGNAGPEVVSTESDLDLYTPQIDLVAAHCAHGEAIFPAPTWADTLGNMKVLDAWRKEVGVCYEAEDWTKMKRPLGRDRPERSASSGMTFGRIPGLSKPMARLVMGGVSSPSIGGQIALDAYFELGGNAFDSAYIYTKTDAALGHWISSRGVRDEVVVIAKGGLTPNCTPEGIVRELEESLRDLGMDQADIYIMHRDNPDVPVGEFVDLMNRLRGQGRFEIFGGSNWTMERLEAANRYAAERGLQGFSILNNQFSLARMVRPVWPGCLSAADLASRQWLEATQFPLLAWSSQARGFFTPRADPADRSNGEMVRSWYADDNFERKRRAAELARERGCEEINIALSYVLSQPFPVWTLIGPASIGEVRSCFEALRWPLTADELRWLNLEDERPAAS